MPAHNNGYSKCGLTAKNEDIATKQIYRRRTRKRFQNPPLAIAKP